MSFVTYVLLTGLVLGTQQRCVFRPLSSTPHSPPLHSTPPHTHTHTLTPPPLHSTPLTHSHPPPPPPPTPLHTHTRFTPEHLGLTASSLLAWLLAEVVIIWLCLYILAVSSQLKWMDIIAYCGYKYVRSVHSACATELPHDGILLSSCFCSMIVCVALGLLGGSYAYYGALVYTALAIAYFLVSTYIHTCTCTLYITG